MSIKKLVTIMFTFGDLFLFPTQFAQGYSIYHYFGSIVESIDLYKWENEISALGVNDSNQDYQDVIIRKHEKDTSIKMIKLDFRIPKKFSFQLVSNDDVRKIIKDLKNSKSVKGEIPTKILKECEFTFEILTECVNKSFSK